MYAPSNTVINTLLRWPLLAAAGAAIAAVSTTGVLSTIAAIVLGSIVGALGLTKVFNDQLCDCESKGYKKFSGARIDWIVEFDNETGNERPWKVYSIFAGLDYTKQHYASYSTEISAQTRIEELRELAGKVQQKSDD